MSQIFFKEKNKKFQKKLQTFLRIQKKKGSCCLNPFESVFVSGNPATTAAPGGGDPPNPLPPGRHQAPRSGIFSGGDHRRAGTRRRGPGYFLAVAPRRLGLPAPCFDHPGGTAARVVVAYHHTIIPGMNMNQAPQHRNRIQTRGE